jgi:hypothetical protein
MRADRRCWCRKTVHRLSHVRCMLAAGLPLHAGPIMMLQRSQPGNAKAQRRRHDLKKICIRKRIAAPLGTAAEGTVWLCR